MLDNAWYIDGATGVTVTTLGSNANVAGATVAIASATVPAGALIVVLTSEATSGSAGTLADGASNSYSTATSGAMSGAAGFGTLFYIANCAALTAQAITFTKQTSGRAASITAFYVTGIATSTPLDAAVTATTAVNSATPTVTSGTPGQAQTFIVGACAYGSAPATKTLTNTGSFLVPFDNVTAQSTANGGGGNINISGGAPVTFNPTLSGACDNRTMIVGFKLATAATGWWGVTQWANKTAAAGEIIRQATTPAVGSERVFVCTTAGATGATEPTWTTTRGAINASSTARYQEATGVAALNGDLTNTPLWSNASIKNTAITLGQVIQRVSGASYQICTAAGTAGNGAEPSFSNTAGTTTADNTVTWTSLGAVGNFTIFAAPHARLVNAYTATWGVAGNSFYAHNTHSEVQTTALTLTSPGTLASPTYTASVGTGAVPPTSVTAGATISTTGASNITINGSVGASYEGITFQAGNAGSAANISLMGGSSMDLRYRSCGFTLNNTNVNSTINLAASASGVAIFDSPTFTFGSTSQGFAGSTFVSRVEINNPTFAGSVPTTLFVSYPSFLTLLGGDLNAFSAGKTLFGAATSQGVVVVQDCKLNASVTKSATPTNANAAIYYVRSDSAATNYITGKDHYAGTLTTDIVTVRTGGASAGTPISWKVIPTTNCKWMFPFVCVPLRTVINPLVSANLTLRLRGTWSGGAVPTNRDCWMTLDYLGTSGFPLGVINTGTVASNLASSSPHTADTTSVWGAGGTTNFYMETILSSPQPLIAGSINVWIYVGASSGTFWFDPLVSLT